MTWLDRGGGDRVPERCHRLSFAGSKLGSSASALRRSPIEGQDRRDATMQVTLIHGLMNPYKVSRGQLTKWTDIVHHSAFLCLGAPVCLHYSCRWCSCPNSPDHHIREVDPPCNPAGNRWASGCVQGHPYHPSPSAGCCQLATVGSVLLLWCLPHETL